MNANLEEGFKRRLLDINAAEIEEMCANLEKRFPESAKNLRRYWREARGMEGTLQEMSRPLIEA